MRDQAAPRGRRGTSRAPPRRPPFSRAWHRKYDEDFARAGYRPRVVERATSPQRLLALVAAGVGVTRLAMSARSLRHGGVAFIPLTGDEAAVVLVRRDDAPNPALPAFRAVAREVGRTLDLADAG